LSDFEARRKSIIRKKARVAEIDDAVARPVWQIGPYGRPTHTTAGSRKRLYLERQRLLWEIANEERDYAILISLNTAPAQQRNGEAREVPATTQEKDDRLNDKLKPQFHWQDVDHTLVNLKLTDLSEDMRTQLTDGERKIYFDNRLNENSMAVPHHLFQLRKRIADERVQKTYDIHCQVWEKQGYARSAEFLRAVYSHSLLPTLRAQAGAIAEEFSMFALRTNLPKSIVDPQIEMIRREMGKLEARWYRRIEAEARESELAVKSGSYGGPQPMELAADRVASAVSEIQEPLLSSLEGSSLTPEQNNEENIREVVIRKVQNPDRYTILSVPETSVYFQVGRRTVYRWLAESKLRSGGRRGSITITSVLQWQKKRSRKRQPH
jgi:hypothetical protein